jgi:hypothetical protein
MSPATSTLPFSDPGLFQQAAEAAESQYSTWIRATLRQVAVEAIRKSLTVNHDLNQLILSQSAWIQVESFCKRMASQWCEKLEQIGHKAVAARIREIVSQESASLFAPNTLVPAAAAAASAGETPTAPTLEQPLTTILATEPASAPLLPNNQTATCITAYSRLRQLGQRNVLATSPQPLLSAAKAGAYLQKIGRLNQTEWPYDWRLIDDAVAQVPARLHNSNTGDFVTTLIPKSVWEQQQQQQHPGQQPQEQESNPPLGVTREAAQLLLDRKRKSAGRERLKPPRRQIDESSSTAVGAGGRTIVREQDIPRPFSRDDGTAQWTMQQIKSSWSRAERQQLDSCLHDDHMDDESGGPAPSIILGALSDGGRFHRWIQKEIDENGNNSNNDDDDDNNKYTEKKRRRLQNDAVKERLGDHHEETTDFLARRRQRVSRVMRTCITTSASKDSSDKNANNSCFDFDMSDSWLEWIDPGTGDRTLYAFSSLEVIALDQDDDDDNDGNNENDEEDQIIDMREDED